MVKILTNVSPFNVPCSSCASDVAWLGSELGDLTCHDSTVSGLILCWDQVATHGFLDCRSLDVHGPTSSTLAMRHAMPDSDAQYRSCLDPNI